jgi:hypothetical protein
MNRNPIKYYHEFVNEAFRDDDEKRGVKDEMDNLIALRDAGMIEPEQIKRRRHEIVRQAGGSRAMMQDPILGEVMAPDLYRALQSPEWQALEADGWQNIANDRHLFNGTLIISANQGRSGLQITTNRYVRRVYPNSGQQAQVVINHIPGDGINLYLNAFRWVKAIVDPRSDISAFLPKRARQAVETPLTIYGKSRM